VGDTTSPAKGAPASARSRGRLSRSDVIEATILLADEVGLEGIRLNLLAERLDIRAPSLYTHIASLEDLLDAVSVYCVGEVSERIVAAADGKVGAEALRAVAHGWREYSRSHPARFHAMSRPVSGWALGEIKELSKPPNAVFTDIMLSFNVPEAKLPAATRALRAALQGFSVVEVDFSLSRKDDTFDFFLEMLLHGLQQPS
jgi:AcrR family transcriptional regulator